MLSSGSSRSGRERRHACDIERESLSFDEQWVLHLVGHGRRRGRGFPHGGNVFLLTRLFDTLDRQSSRLYVIVGYGNVTGMVDARHRHVLETQACEIQGRDSLHAGWARPSGFGQPARRIELVERVRERRSVFHLPIHFEIRFVVDQRDLWKKHACRQPHQFRDHVRKTGKCRLGHGMPTEMDLCCGQRVDRNQNRMCRWDW